MYSFMQAEKKTSYHFSSHAFTRYGPPWGISTACVNPGSEQPSRDPWKVMSFNSFGDPPNPQFPPGSRALPNDYSSHLVSGPPIGPIFFFQAHYLLYFFINNMGCGSIALDLGLKRGVTSLEGSKLPRPHLGGGHGPQFKEAENVGVYDYAG